MGLLRKGNEPVKERLKVSTVLFSLLCLLGIASQTHGVVDYCDEHTYETNSSYLQFTKEISNREYALANKFKSLHCCAKGYRSIEWYKDGNAYPWPSGVSNFILYPESANQTVYAQTAAPIDSGNYSCVVRNDSHVITHSVLLFVLEAEVDEVGYTGSPLPTYEPKDRYARKGDSARFFCEAFVGRVDLPDAKSEVRWWRSIPSEGEAGAEPPQAAEGSFFQEGSGQELDGAMVVMGDASRHHHHHHYHRKHHVKPKPRFHQEVVSREDNQILGAYLLIREVQNEDFGEYRCSVRNAVGEHTLLMSSWLQEEDVIEDKTEEEEVKFLVPNHSMLIYLVISLISVMFVCFLVIFSLNWKINIFLIWKDYCRKKEDGDGKEYDVCVFYESKGNAVGSGIGPNSETPKSVALCHIIPTFESHQGYQCFTHPLPLDHSPLTVPQAVYRAIERSRRLLIVINPSRQTFQKIPPPTKPNTCGDWCDANFCNSISELLKLHPRSICLVLKEKIQGQKRHPKVQQKDWMTVFNWGKNEDNCRDDLSIEEDVFTQELRSRFGENIQVMLWSGVPAISSPEWKKLLLAMPPKKTEHNSNLKTVPVRRSASHNTLSNSQESLQVLV